MEDDQVSAELMEAPVLEEEATEEVVEAVSAMTQKNLLEVTVVVGAILPVPVEVPVVVREAGGEVLPQACLSVAGHRETLLAAALEELGLRRLEMEALMELELVETSVEREEALAAEPEAPMRV